MIVCAGTGGGDHLSCDLAQLDVDASIFKAELHQLSGRPQMAFQFLGLPLFTFPEPTQTSSVICENLL
jgi:hypothetical protein